ncbi:MAG: lipopolysaccharide heptosyltransferase II [Planctomycetota bacterium]
MAAADGKTGRGRVAVVMPTWLGDAVMATPTLRAVRERFPDARIEAWCVKNLRPMLRPMPWIDRVRLYDKRGGGLRRAATRMRRARYDTALVLPNSWRSAWLVWRGGARRRVGYAREGRGWMLTDRLTPPREADGRWAMVPTLRYYLGAAGLLGAATDDAAMGLFVSDGQRRSAERVMRAAGLSFEPIAEGRRRLRPIVLLNPGAQNPAKRWPAERFARVADVLTRDADAQVAVTGSPAERAVLDAVVESAHAPVADLASHGLTLGALKGVVAAADLMITNDTGPRHLAAALNTPAVTLFGPTDPGWTTIDAPAERLIVAPDAIDATPAERRRFVSAPRRMGDIAVSKVVMAAAELLAETGVSSPPEGSLG